MKKHFKSLLVVAFLFGMATTALGQTSTEGRRFWIALPFSNGPSGALQDFEPFIAISAKKACTVTLSQPAGTWGSGTAGNPVQQFNVSADSWTIVSNGLSFTTALTIPDNVWYDKNWTFTSASEPNNPFPYGILVEATEDISVYAAMRGNASYDATNVLPEPTLRSEYLIQDYPGYDHQNNCGHSVIIIVGTENNTQVDIEYTAPTVGGTQAGSKRTITLNKGQTYQVLSAKEQTFSGTKITAKEDKKIAVFSGADFTQVPGAKSARDCLYEQAMPLDYWGTQFVVTRSLQKDANRIRITAMTDGTTITIDGTEIPEQFNAGDTYEFEMSENLAKGDMASAIAAVGRTAPDILTGDVHYIETSCPCAVFNYDVSSGYVQSTTADKVGDPSMVWMSPLQQRITKITFGACGTKKRTECYTNEHYVNVVCLTEDISTFLLTSASYPNGRPVNFDPVPGNPKYSYARVYLGKVGEGEPSNADKVFTMSCNMGFIAHVYGSGKNESYAYSVGSAAVKQGVNVDGETFTDGYRSDSKFCSGSELTFNAKVGTDEITRVDWDFGDGITEQNGDPVTTHTYNTPGWYDVSADLYGHQVCTDEDNVWLGTVSFTFRVWRHDTIVVPPTDKVCLEVEEAQAIIDNYGIDSLNYLLANGVQTIITPADTPCYIDRELAIVPYGMKTINKKDTLVGRDQCTGYNGKIYYESTDVVDTTENDYGCQNLDIYYVKVLTCLAVEFYNKPEEQFICLYEDHSLPVEYEKFKGDIKDEKAIFTINELPKFKEELYISNANIRSTLNLPMEDANKVKVEKPGHYTGKITIEDPVCSDYPREYTINFSVFYPSTIFQFKFNNVLAVYKPGYGGNKDLKAEFTNYQWYRNNAPIAGATESILYLGEGITFNEGDEVFVVLKDKNGLELPSCPQKLENIPDYSPEANKAPAHKVIRNQNIVIVREEKTYNIYGQRVQ